MLDLILIYKWTLVAGVLAAPALALLGIQLATRDRAMQTLCVGQGAMFGVLLGLGGFATLIHSGALGDFFHQFEETAVQELFPFVTAFLASATTFVIAELLVRKRAASKNTFFAFLLVVLMAGSYLMSSLFPALENHMSQIYFGDLATLTEFYATIMIVASIASIFFLVAMGKAIANESFELAVFGSRPGLKAGFRFQWFQFFSLLVLCFSVQYVGFLFTISMLFLPTSVLKFMEARTLRTHMILAATTSSLGTTIGFLISLQYTRMPTVPTITVVTMALCLGVLGIERVTLFLTRKRGVVSEESLTEPLPQFTGGRG